MFIVLFYGLLLLYRTTQKDYTIRRTSTRGIFSLNLFITQKQVFLNNFRSWINEITIFFLSFMSRHNDRRTDTELC